MTRNLTITVLALLLLPLVALAWVWHEATGDVPRGVVAAGWMMTAGMWIMIVVLMILKGG